jgi:hypothetical protein
MNRTIWKYIFAVTDEVTIDMPQGARLLPSPAMNPREVHKVDIWAEVDPAAPVVTRRLSVRGTGHPLGNPGTWIGTIRDGVFVWHVYDAGEA